MTRIRLRMPSQWLSNQYLIESHHPLLECPLILKEYNGGIPLIGIQLLELLLIPNSRPVNHIPKQPNKFILHFHSPEFQKSGMT